MKMKRMILALVAMVMMSGATAMAQSGSQVITIDSVSKQLELSVNQKRKMTPLLGQFTQALKSVAQMTDEARKPEALERIKTRHLTQTKEVLTRKQYQKYETMVSESLGQAQRQQ